NRLTNTPLGEQLQSTGGLAWLPGPLSPDYWTWPDQGPRTIRNSSPTDPQVQDWLNNATDERIDEIASKFCAIAYLARTSDNTTSRDQTIDQQLTPQEQSQHPSLAPRDVFDLVTKFYCPDVPT
ncbi:MAG: hypothetical protein AAFO29_10115, partial [Actinomycetota bacterium]